jgi:ubiquitin C-terminal hydrolase
MLFIEKYDLTDIFLNKYKITFECKCGKKRLIESNSFVVYSDQTIPLDKFLYNRQTTLRCNKCNSNILETYQYLNAPPIITILLPKYDEKKVIKYPLEFSIKGKSKPLVYYLKAVIDHHGDTNGGHYVATCKRDDTWYRFNDDTYYISDIAPTLTNYLLFYEKSR